MSATARGTTLENLMGLRNQLIVRSNALTSYTGSPGDVEFDRRADALRNEIAKAEAEIAAGRGTIDQYIWLGFQTLVRDTTNILLTQADRTFSAEADEPSASTTTARTTTRTTTRTTSSSSSSSEPSAPTSWDDWEQKLAPSTLWLSLNPPGEPIYRKPITWIVLAAAAGIGYVIYKETR